MSFHDEGSNKPDFQRQCIATFEPNLTGHSVKVFSLFDFQSMDEKYVGLKPSKERSLPFLPFAAACTLLNDFQPTSFLSHPTVLQVSFDLLNLIICILQNTFSYKKAPKGHVFLGLKCIRTVKILTATCLIIVVLFCCRPF